MRILILLSLLILSGNMMAQRINLLHYLIKSDNTINFVIEKSSLYEPQILYTQVDRDSTGQIHLKTLRFNVNEEEYFYPASMVKLPVALLALQKINELAIPGITKETYMLTDSAYPGQSKVTADTTSSTGYPSIAHYIKKLFLISDNDAFNRLYEFLGQEYINEELRKKGYSNSKVTHRLAISLPPDQNRCTNPVYFINEREDTIYSQSLICTEKDYSNNLNSAFKGIGYIQEDSLINKPRDFSHSNFMSLPDLHRILISAIYPEAVKPVERFNLKDEDYSFIRKYMSMLPRESDNPAYDTSYYDSYVKFLLFGSTRDSIPDNIRIFNKIGMAYGYLSDNAYVADLKSNIEFFLSAVIYVNRDGIFNDDKYEYDTVGFPFLHNLGRTIYNYELVRERMSKPDLERFRFNYSE
jgi:hypothetical protein